MFFPVRKDVCSEVVLAGLDVAIEDVAIRYRKGVVFGGFV